MGSFYERPDIYDLFDNPKKDAATKAHWQTLLEGRNIKTALDVSIGTGSLTLPMAELGMTLYGSDLSEKMLEKCAEKARNKNVAVDLRPCDFRLLTQAFDQKFDLVASTGNSLPYVENADVALALSQMDALVKKGGYLYFDTRNWDKIVYEKQRFYTYNSIFKDDLRVNIVQAWDHHPDGSMTFNILYTFEKENKIIDRVTFEEHYHPVRLQFMLNALENMGYTDVRIAPLPAQFGEFDIQKTDWYCVIAKKA